MKLEELVGENVRAGGNIRALRDGVCAPLLLTFSPFPSSETDCPFIQLLSASAVLEARTAVAQGANVRALTLVSMVFLPASFSTSIFGMQILSQETTSVYTFAIVISVLCGVTYLVILKLGAFSGNGRPPWGGARGFEARKID